MNKEKELNTEKFIKLHLGDIFIEFESHRNLDKKMSGELYLAVNDLINDAFTNHYDVIDKRTLKEELEKFQEEIANMVAPHITFQMCGRIKKALQDLKDKLL